jgi:transposase
MSYVKYFLILLFTYSYLYEWDWTMDIASYQFKSDEIQMLNKYRDEQQDVRLKIRFIALLMLAQGVSVEIIASSIGKSVKTIENWFQQYRAKGIDSLNSFSYKPKQAFLNQEQIEQLTTWVKRENPAKVKQIKAYIKEHYGVDYSVEAVRQLLHKHGLKLLRPKLIPGGSPSEEEQREFIEKYHAIKSSSKSGTVILFVDGMHLIHQLIAGLCWGDPLDPPVMETNTGRKRLNILGAYDPDSHSLVHLTGEENCDAKRIIEFYALIINAYPNASKIIIIRDNAAYFNAEIVTEWLKEHPVLHIEPLPPYAPNLNLIERFWRFAKEHLVRNTYYKKYITFRAKVFQFLNHVDKYTDELKTLIVEKFQVIQHKLCNQHKLC